MECKRQAKALTFSQNSPCNCNGRRKGYIEAMKELWDEKGYGHLELKSQNLRDQASRLEKMELDESARAGDSNANASYIAATHGHGSSREFGQSENQNIIGHQCENSNISMPLSNLDLYTYATRSLEDGSANDPTSVESPPQDHFEMPGCLPD